MRCTLVLVLGVLHPFVEAEIQTVEAFVSDGQVGEDEVTSLAWTIQIRDPGDRDTG